jgi:uncharacterized protein YhbP (UPF0306 family)
MRLNLAYFHPKYSDASLNASIQSILEANELMGMATVCGSEAYSNTAYFAFNEQMDIFVLCEPTTQHSQNLVHNQSMAAAIFDSHQPWTSDKRGLQLFGTCEIASGTDLAEAVARYLKRFVGLKQWVTNPDDILRGAINSKFYVMRVTSLKLFDEPTFGKEEFISLVPKRN